MKNRMHIIHKLWYSIYLCLKIDYFQYWTLKVIFGDFGHHIHYPSKIQFAKCWPVVTTLCEGLTLLYSCKYFYFWLWFTIIPSKWIFGFTVIWFLPFRWTERTALRSLSSLTENIFKFLFKLLLLLTPSDCDNIIWYQIPSEVLKLH